LARIGATPAQQIHAFPRVIPTSPIQMTGCIMRLSVCPLRFDPRRHRMNFARDPLTALNKEAFGTKK
jgi:hypothetical protein